MNWPLAQALCVSVYIFRSEGTWDWSFGISSRDPDRRQLGLP